MAKSSFAKDQLKSFVNRIERLNEEREALSADIREVFSEAKGTGFDTKILRQVVALRKLDSADFQEREAMLDLYLGALGMRGTPLQDFAERRDVDPKLVERVAQAVQTPAGRAALGVAVDVMIANQEAQESQAKATVEDPVDSTQYATGEEVVSRAVSGRSETATSERMDETGGESAATGFRDFTKEDIPLPAFLDRRPKAATQDAPNR